MTDAQIIAIALAAGFGAGLVSVWRWWAIRTWRTVAACVIGSLLAGIALAAFPYPPGLLIAMPTIGATLWVVASGTPQLVSISRPDYEYANGLAVADEMARRLLSGRSNASPEAITALEQIISSLSTAGPHPAWEAARLAKIEELELAKAILIDGGSINTDVPDLRSLRLKAARLFFAARRSRSSFWRTPPAEVTD